MENRDNKPQKDNRPLPQPQPSLHVVPGHAEELLQIQQQRQEMEAWELKIKKREDELYAHDIELLKLQHQLGTERFKLCAKTLISLAALLAGFYLHMNEDNLGAFLIGSGLGGFGVTMATGTSYDPNNNSDS